MQRPFAHGRPIGPFFEVPGYFSSPTQQSVSVEASNYSMRLVGSEYKTANLVDVDWPDDWSNDYYNVGGKYVQFGIADSQTGGIIMEMWTETRPDKTVLYHLEVPEDRRGEGLGSFGFDVYRCYALLRQKPAAGVVGGNVNTEMFLQSMGIPEDDIEPSGGTLVREIEFMTDVAELEQADHATITVQ